MAAVWSYFACTPTTSPCPFHQTPHTTAHHCVARHAAFDPPLSPQGANVGMLRLHFTKCCCYILPARPPPAPDRFARHHTPQHAIAKQGLWRLGHHRLSNFGLYRTRTPSLFSRHHAPRCANFAHLCPILQAPHTTVYSKMQGGYAVVRGAR